MPSTRTEKFSSIVPSFFIAVSVVAPILTRLCFEVKLLCRILTELGYHFVMFSTLSCAGELVLVSVASFFMILDAGLNCCLMGPELQVKCA